MKNFPFSFEAPVARRALARVAAVLLMSATALVQAKPFASGVIVHYRVQGAAAIGQPYTVIVDFSNVVERGATVSFSASPGLVLRNAEPLVLAAGKTSVTLQATPSDNGLKFVNVFTRQGTGGSATSIPVQVGPVASPQDRQEKRGTVTIRPDGRAVRLLPIQ